MVKKIKYVWKENRKLIENKWQDKRGRAWCSSYRKPPKSSREREKKLKEREWEGWRSAFLSPYNFNIFHSFFSRKKNPEQNEGPFPFFVLSVAYKLLRGPTTTSFAFEVVDERGIVSVPAW